MKKSGIIYDLSKAEVTKALKGTLGAISKSEANQVILIAGTGVPSLEAIEEMIGSIAIPVVTSQTAGIWNLFSSMNLRQDISSSGSVALNELDRHINESAMR
jgi:maleate cis-trans isomerase